MTNVIKTVIELAAYNTSVFYQVHNIGVLLDPETRHPAYKKLADKYHCVSCKKKGIIDVEHPVDSVYKHKFCAVAGLTAESFPDRRKSVRASGKASDVLRFRCSGHLLRSFKKRY